MRRFLKQEEGQASLEYLLVGLVMIAMMGALATLWHFMESGSMTGLIEEGSSHAMFTIGGLCDALLF